MAIFIQFAIIILGFCTGIFEALSVSKQNSLDQALIFVKTAGMALLAARSPS
jgi:hypothetical protein